MSSNLQDELLALLNNEQAASCCGIPPPRQNLSRRGGPQSSRSDRRVPPTVKCWAQTSPKCKHRRIASQKHKGNIRRLLRISLNDQLPRVSGLGLLRYLALIVIGFCSFFYSKIASNSDENERHQAQLQFNSFFLRRSYNEDKASPRAQFSFIDSSWRGKYEVQFETLIPPSEINFALQRRLLMKEESNCDDILLFLPLTVPNQSHGVELNGYVLAALLATYMGKAMVILDVPMASKLETGSWFDCPLHVFENITTHEKDFPTGFSRLLQHPLWLSRGCPIPCQTSHDFSKWNNLRKQHIQQTTCQNDNDRQAVVLAVGVEEARQYFERQLKEQMLERPSATAYGWALRLGAKGYEAQTFAKLIEEEDIWDFVSAFMARSGVIRFQPWIARDIKAAVKSTDLPLNWPYIAIYVYRAEKHKTESREFGPSLYSTGFQIEAEQRPTLVPFHNYLHQWDRLDCNVKAHPVYIVTDDQPSIQNEIDMLPKASGDNTIIQECHKTKFIFSSFKPSQLHDLHPETDCLELHRANIAAMADLMILSKSDVFVGEFNSDVGRLVRIFRTAVNNFPGMRNERPVLLRNALVASGVNDPGSPGI